MLTLLRKIIESVIAAPSLQEAMRNLVAKTKESLNADCCSIYLAEPKENRFRLASSDGLLAEAIGKTTLPYGDGLVGLVGRKLEPINLADAPAHPNFKYLPEVGEDCFRSFLGVPIVEQRELLGVLVAQRKASKKFDESDESFMVTLAAQLASKIAHAQMLNRMQAAHSFSGPIRGIAASKGRAVAPAFVWYPQLDMDQVAIVHTDDIFTQIELFRQAVFQVQLDLDRLMLRLNQTSARSEVPEIFEIYSMMINDSSFSEKIVRAIGEQKLMAVSAVKLVCQEMISQLATGGSRYLQDRAVDIKDVAQRILSKLAHNQAAKYNLDSPVILVADEVSASLLMEIPTRVLKGVVSLKGSVNSHAAIMARSLNIPAVMGVELPLDAVDRRTIVVDGNRGEIIVDPDSAVKEEYLEIISRNRHLQELVEKEFCQPVVSVDGQRVYVALNAGLNVDMKPEEKRVIDGVGLYRTEIPFLLQRSFPTELEQENFYSEFLGAFRDVPVCMRTLDVGGDKQLPYFRIEESNPALGWRGIRMTLDNQSMLMSQYRAMLRASGKFENLSIMIPMVTSAEEVREARRLLDEAFSEVSEEMADAGRTLKYPKFGAMIEVPSMIYILEDIAPLVDFFSIGSNDLTQYLLAVDRSNSKVSDLYNPYHPAVLRALRDIRRRLECLDRKVDVCGEMCGDATGMLLLLGFGYRIFSMNLSCMAKIRYLIRRIDVSRVTELVEKNDLKDIGVLREQLTEYACSQGLQRFVCE
ncbi:MAG: phosphoenolpyruvate--protein phosphotransferase [Succinivibrionaceae bacterium]|nr:phosphoenolpyruvate--protein phosphotransferase [Succinivibrionaceae bacterium]